MTTRTKYGTEYGYWIRGWDGEDHTAHRDANLYPSEDEAAARKAVEWLRSENYTIDVVVVKRVIPDWEVTD